MENIKTKLYNNVVTIGTWLTIGDCAVAEILCQSGFEWITIDMEHSAITISQAQELIRTIDLLGKVPAVRVGENNPNLIKRALDAGAQVIIVPMVNSAEQATAAINAVKYPPRGTRGVGLARAQKYGFGFEEYKEWNDKHSVLVVQIEHIDAINNLEDILKVDGIDATFIGPYDLSGSLGHPGNFSMPEFKQALERYESLSKHYGVPMGYHVVEPDPKLAESKIAAGYKFLAVGVDAIYLGRKCRETLEKIL
ncbi:MAG: aldolase/citrate lyase family protein [Oscillospiraceae bacterium]|nr:aldolase/citrate lyase family protein [Oscillospiraceae bacterium]